MTINQWLFLAFALLSLADVHSTYLALRTGDTERNPVVRFFLDAGGWGAVLLLKAGVLALAWFGLPAIPWPLAVLGNLAMLWVVINNYKNART